MSDCNPHPDAPHGFDRNASLNEDRYVCDCESWSPPNRVTMEQWESAGSDDQFRVTANIFLSVFDDDTDITQMWTGTKAEIECQAAEYANKEMADYPFMHMEIDTVEVLND